MDQPGENVTVEGSRPEAPPFRPNPDLVGNIEGNKKRIRQDREAIRRWLREHPDGR